MSYKTGYPLSLDFFHFVNKVEALDSTCMFGANWRKLEENW